MVISSIDLMKGKAVQLIQGKEKAFEWEDPLSLAKKFDIYGEMAVIDLDAAMGKGENLNTIKEILKIGECRVGGGISNIDRAKDIISLGASKVIIGSKAFENNKVNHPFLQELEATISRYRIIIAIDALKGEIVTKAWTHKTGLSIFDTVKEIEKYTSEFLFTCVEREGILKGIDMAIVRKLIPLTENKITVAGGISSIYEIRELAELGVDVQLGMALYTGKVGLAEAFIESLNWKNPLIPTITQDDKGQILMLAYNNRDSLQKTFEIGRMYYFSRSRNKLWMKGETSGNTQELLKIRADCDKDTLLATVKQKGVACHMGRYSCFSDSKFSLHDLYEVIKDRLDNPKSESYTAKLTDDLLRKKLMEEAQELIEAKRQKDIIWEAADMLYFITVLLAKSGITIEDVIFELARRRKK